MSQDSLDKMIQIITALGGASKGVSEDPYGNKRFGVIPMAAGTTEGFLSLQDRNLQREQMKQQIEQNKIALEANKLALDQSRKNSSRQDQEYQENFRLRQDQLSAYDREQLYSRINKGLSTSDIQLKSAQYLPTKGPDGKPMVNPLWETKKKYEKAYNKGGGINARSAFAWNPDQEAQAKKEGLNARLMDNKVDPITGELTKTERVNPALQAVAEPAIKALTFPNFVSGGILRFALNAFNPVTQKKETVSAEFLRDDTGEIMYEGKGQEELTNMQRVMVARPDLFTESDRMKVAEKLTENGAKLSQIHQNMTLVANDMLVRGLISDKTAMNMVKSTGGLTKYVPVDTAVKVEKILRSIPQSIQAGNFDSFGNAMSEFFTSIEANKYGASSRFMPSQQLDLEEQRQASTGKVQLSNKAISERVNPKLNPNIAKKR